MEPGFGIRSSGPALAHVPAARLLGSQACGWSSFQEPRLLSEGLVSGSPLDSTGMSPFPEHGGGVGGALSYSALQ